MAIALLVTAAVLAHAQTYLLVVNKSDSTLDLVDPASLKVLATVPTGFTPHEVAAENGFAFVSNYGNAQQPGHSLTVVDLRARKGQEIELPGLFRPHGIMASGGKIFFTAEGSRAVARFDPLARRVDWLMGTGQDITHQVVVAATAGRLYTANIGSDTVTSMPLATGKLRQIAVGKGPEGMDLSPDGRELWVAARGDGNLDIIDTQTETVRQTLRVGKMPIRVKFTPDGRHVLVSDATANQVVVFEAASRREIARLEVPGTPVGILIAPDGKRAFVAQTQLNQIVEIDLKRFTSGRSFQTGHEPDGMAWVEMH
jgi:YVTN family beta-propeller protein